MSTNPEEPSKPSLAEEREAAIRALEANVKKRRLGVRWPTALLAAAVAVVLFYWHGIHRDVAYLLSPVEPVTLGSEGDYRFEALQTNRYAQVHGVPTHIGTFSRHGGEVRVTVGLQGTPVLVHRSALPSEDWPEHRPPSPVDQRPFGIRGRLLVEDQAGRYSAAFERLGALDSVQRREGKLWIILEGQRPRSDPGTLILASLLIAFVGLNLWFAARDLAARRA